MTKEKKKIEGIGGWLILPVIGVIFSSIYYLFDTIEIISALPEYPRWVFLITLGMVFLYTYTAFLIFNKNKNAPQFFIIAVWINFIYQSIFLWITGSFTAREEMVLIFTAPFIGAIIWTPYFLFSRRVKNTFVN